MSALNINRPPRSYLFSFFAKMLLKVVHYHLRSLNVRNFGTVAATELEIMASRSPSMA
jgi:hypothetical protein